MNWMPEAIRDGVLVILIISGPLVIAAAVIGLSIGILQAATQVQEQTIGSALKIIGVFSLIITLGFWMYQYLTQYTHRAISSAFTFVPQQTRKVIPKDGIRVKLGSPREVEIPAVPQLLQPRKIESNIPQGIPPNVPGLGSPEPPKQPSVGEILPPPPPDIPDLPGVKPDIPLSDIQELMPIPAPPNGENINGEVINLVPGEPATTREARLWHRKELFSYSSNEISSYKDEGDLSWLN